MTPNGVAVAAAGLAALAGWLLYGYPPAFAVAAVCAALLLVGLPAHLRRRKTVRVDLTCPAPEAERGDSLTFTVSATGRAVAELTVGDAHRSVPLTVSGRPVRWDSPPLPRGRLTVAADRLTDGDVLGLWRRRLPFTGGNVTLVVRPRYADLATPPDTLDHEQDGRPAPLGSGPGVTFAGLREYEAGDDIRHIDWSASARSADDTVYVRQFAPALTEDLVVVLDAYRPGSAADFETAVDLAYSFVRAGADLWVTGDRQPYRGLAEAEEALLTVVPSAQAALPAGSLPMAATTMITAAAGRVAELRRACAPAGPIFRIGDPATADGGEQVVRVRELAQAQAAWASWASA